MWLIRCFHCFEKKKIPSTDYFQILALLEARWPNGRHSIPLQWRDSLWTRLYTHTHTQPSRTCQRALPADELGHFSFAWLQGIQCVVMEHSHIRPKLWRDNYFPILYLSLQYLRLLPGAGWEEGQRLPHVHTISSNSLPLFCFLWCCLCSSRLTPNSLSLPDLSTLPIFPCKLLA